MAPRLCTTGLPEATDDRQLQVKFKGIGGQLYSEPRGLGPVRTRANRTDCFTALHAVHAQLGHRYAPLYGEVVAQRTRSARFRRRAPPPYGQTANARRSARDIRDLGATYLDGRSFRHPRWATHTGGR